MVSTGPAPRIVELAATISESVAKLQEILTSQGLPSPSFDEDGLTLYPDEASDARDAVLDASTELYDVMLEPLSLLFQRGGHNNMTCIQAICRLRIASMVPAGGKISYGELAQKTGLNEVALKRLLRHAITQRIFCEPEPGMVAHNKISKQLAIPHIRGWMSIGAEDMWPAAVRMLDALQKWPESEEATETGFQLANNTTDSIYTAIGASPERSMRFAGAMQAYAESPGLDIRYALDNYDWAALGKALVVDIGGSRGHVAMGIAKRFDNLSIQVQDMEPVVDGAELGVPEEFKGRVTFQATNFFAPQTVAAEVYFFRWILHNWSDKYCRLILQAQIPMLKPGSRLLIQDICMPEPGQIALWRERDLRAQDMNMGAVFNSRERTVSEWKSLLAQADPRFVLRGVTEPRGSELALIDVRWAGTE